MDLVCEKTDMGKRGSVATIERPRRGRPRNNFVSYKHYWCLPCASFCDIARKSSKCMEESPEHAMPFPFSSFNCQKFVELPKKYLLQFSEEILTKVLQSAFLQVMTHLGAGTNIKLKINEITQEVSGSFSVGFIVNYRSKEGSREKHIEVIIPWVKAPVI